MAKYMRVDMGFSPEFPRGKLAAMQERLDKLLRMSKKQLVAYAEKEFKLYLGEQYCNGKPYLFRKVAYHEQKRMMGLTEKAVKRLADLDKPETIKAYQDEERIKQEGTTMVTKKTIKKATKKTSAKKETVQSTLRELVMEGKLTDDQIFARVQKKFGKAKLPDKRRNYVSWTRNDCKKKGLKPPAIKLSAADKKKVVTKKVSAKKTIKKVSAKKTIKKVSAKKAARSKHA